MLIKFLQRTLARDRHDSCVRCYKWGGELVANLKPKSLLDVGCGDGGQLFKYLQHKPDLFCGIEGSPALREKAEARGIKTVCCAGNDPDHADQILHLNLLDFTNALLR